MSVRVPVVLAPLVLLGCTGDPATEPAPSFDPVSLRVVTYNASLYGDSAGEIATRLAGDDAQARDAAQVLQLLQPDVLLVNELDVDATADNAAAFNTGYLAVSQNGLDPLDFPYVYTASSNTGVHSGFDLDNSGSVTSTPGSGAYGGDAWGFGEYEGQYGFAVFSRFPIDGVRTFQELTWDTLPDNRIPPDWFEPDERAAVRLSSKNHVDVALQVGEGPDQVLHVLASHPTPPAFDGPEDRNGRRNADEIRLWADYLDGGPGAYHVDDDGVSGALEGTEAFVIVGDLNADPNDGSGSPEAIAQLLDHPLVQADPVPTSEGAVEQNGLQGGINASHGTPAGHDTADFEDSNVGNLRLDYVLPSSSVTVEATGVFWPTEADPDFALIGTFPFPISDHRPVWADIVVP